MIVLFFCAVFLWLFLLKLCFESSVCQDGPDPFYCLSVVAYLLGMAYYDLASYYASTTGVQCVAVFVPIASAERWAALAEETYTGLEYLPVTAVPLPDMAPTDNAVYDIQSMDDKLSIFSGSDVEHTEEPDDSFDVFFLT